METQLPRPQPAPTRTNSLQPEPTEPENTAPIAIDWAKEAERAAAHRIEADEEADRRASALSPRRGQSVGAPEATFSAARSVVPTDD